jgi:alcohol dehydrogenase class IV
VFPTTFGTGAELSFGAILFDDSKDIKSGIRGELVQADKVFLDFELYKSAPARIKSLAGYDCLTHAIETYLSLKSSELTRYQSVAAINTVFEYLYDAVTDNSNAISKMAIASMLMGVNLAYSSTCLPHRLQYVIGPMTHTSHAEGLAALYKGYLPYICSMEEGPIIELCEDLNITKDGLEERISNLKNRLDISLSLSDLGIRDKEVQHILDSVTGNLSADPYYKDSSTMEIILNLAL